MTAIYNALVDFRFGDNSFTRQVEELLSSLCEEEYENIDSYIKDTVILSLQNYGMIASKYQPYLNSWKWERLPLLTQSILLMSYTHYYLVEKVDRRVIINVAVELAKKYIDDKQAKFINAILDNGVLKNGK